MKRVDGGRSVAGVSVKGGIVALIAATAVALLLALPAGAVGYPPPPGPTSSSLVITIDVGTSGTVSACGFAPGAAVSLSINGAGAGGATANSSGCVALTYTATAGPRLSVDGGPSIAARFGDNSSVATGANPAGSTNTVYITVDVVRAGTGAGSGSGGASGGSGGLATTATASGVAFTGADIAAIVVGGLALLAMGTLVIIFARRRKPERT